MKIWPAVALFVLLAFNAIVSPGFFEIVMKNGMVYGSVVDIFFRAAPLIIVALGMTLVIATGGVDLSVGTVAALAAAMAAYTFALGASAGVAIAAALGIGIAVGLFNSFLIVALGVQPIIASLIAMVTGRGFAALLVNGQIVPLENEVYRFFGNGVFAALPFSITMAIIFVLVLHLFLSKTAAGLFVQALGSNPLASKYIGLNTWAVRTFVYVTCAFCAAVAGIILSSNIRAVDVNNLGLFLELDAILAVVIGGTRLTGGRFSLIGSVFGALIIQTVTTTINTQGIAVQSMLMVKAAVVVAICLAQTRKGAA